MGPELASMAPKKALIAQELVPMAPESALKTPELGPTVSVPKTPQVLSMVKDLPLTVPEFVLMARH